MRSIKKSIGITAIVIALILSLIACSPAATPPPPTGPNNGIVTEGDVCTDIIITQMPSKLTYQDGERFNPAGLVFDAVYENGYDEDVDLTASDLDGWSPSGALNESVKQVTLLFEGVQKKIDITVTPKTLLDMAITREPDTKSYSVGDPLDLSGLTVWASYEEGDVAVEDRYTVTDADGNEYTNGTLLTTPSLDFELTVSVTAGDVTLSDTFSISVYAGFSLQAEDYWDPNGDKPRPTDKSYTILKGAQIEGWLVMTDCTYTGTGYIGNITAGVRLEFYIYSTIYIENAELVLVAAATLCNDKEGKMDDMQFNEFCKVYFGDDEQEIYIDDDVIIEGKPYPSVESGGSQWTNWADVPFGRYDIQPGYNKIVIDCVKGIVDSTGSARMPNIDRLDVRMTESEGESGDFIESLTVKQYPTKTEYFAGDRYEPTGLVFDVTYRNGYDGDVDLGADRIKVVEDRPLTAADKKVTLKFKNYEFTVDITVTERVIQSVEITALPDVVSYYSGSILDLTGFTLMATYTDGFIDVDASNYTLTDKAGNVYENGKAISANAESGEVVLTVTVRSGGATATTEFTLNIGTGISIEAEETTAAENKSYVSYEGQYNIASDGDMGADKTGKYYVNQYAAGTKMIYHIYSHTAVKNAIVLLRAASCEDGGAGKMLDTQFNKVFKLYLGQNELPVGNDAVITGKAHGDAPWFQWVKVQIAVIDLEAGYNTLTIECYDTSAYNFLPNIDKIEIITAGDVCTSMTVATQPAKLTYLEGETFDPAGLTFTAAYENGYADDGILGADKITVVTSRPLTVNDKTVTLKYKGYEFTVNVTVAERRVESMEITAPEKTDYESGDELDLTGLVVRAEYEGGVTDDNVADYTIKDDNGKVYKNGDVIVSTEDGTVQITLTVEVSRGGVTKTATFTLSVTNPVIITKGDIVTGIQIVTQPKTEYFVGETFDVTGIVFAVTYQNGFDGDTALDESNLELVTTPLTLEDTSVTVTLKGYNYEFTVDITVAERKIESVEAEYTISAYPNGGVFDFDALTVKTTYEGGLVNDDDTNYVLKDDNGTVCTDGYIVTKDTAFIVEVTSGGVTKTSTFNVTVFDKGETIRMLDQTEVDKQSYVKHMGTTIWDNGEKDCTDYACRFYVGVKIEYHIYSEVAVKDVDFLWRIATNINAGDKMDPMQFNRMFKVYYGDTEITVPDDVIIDGTESGVDWFNWVYIKLATVDLQAGYNIITVEFYNDGYNGSTPNVDRLEIEFGYEQSAVTETAEDGAQQESAIIKEQ